MKSYSIFLKFLLIFLPFLSVAQSEKAAVDIYPHWEKDEIHKISLKSTTTDIANKVTLQYSSTFNANFKVLEKNDDEYLIEWTFTDAKLASNDKIVENILLANLVNKKIRIKFSSYGRFISLVNEDELRTVADKTIDRLMATTSNQSYKMLLTSAKRLISTPQGIESAIIKPIKFYHYCFDHSFKLNEEFVNNVLVPNAIGGAPFNAIEKVKCKNIDQQKSTCIIESSKIADGVALTKAIKDFFIKNNKNQAQTIEKQFSNNNYEVSESTQHEINFETGTVLKASFKRKVNMGVYNRTSLNEIQSAD
ncbi:hypothetical protein [Pedobacter soli]|uniref:Uncharacterized protein n=1 Tax=Pedobacter soli TaxID=390242 RepID=A0A1G6NMA4_9SPHI|nr:hypothetical protein [Pedobacter soli]SDC68427.1 hypothetical protein SAMN04488024_102711 [Pedobacter soli]